MSTQTLYGQAPEQQYTVEIRRRSDFKPIKILNQVLKSCYWEYDRKGGCGKANIELAINPADMRAFQGADFELRINIRNSSDTSEIVYYRGFQEDFKPVERPSGKVIMNFSGYSAMLKRCRVNATYANMEVGAIIRSILDTFVLPNTPITYTLAEHDVSNYIVDTMTFDTDAGSAINTLVTLAGDFEYGVDRNLKFYFKQVSQDVRFMVKYKKDMVSLDDLIDYGGIINQYIIKGSSGFEEPANNTESQSAYGLRSKTISNSAITTSSVAQRYGTGLLADDARPKRRTSVTKAINKQLYETSVPLPKMVIVKEPLTAPTKYGVPIYGDGTLYGGLVSFYIDKIAYRLQSEGTSVKFNLGQPRPDAATQIAQIQNDINQVRNS